MKILRQLFCRHEVAPICSDGQRVFRRCCLCGRETSGFELPTKTPKARFEGYDETKVFGTRALEG